MGEPAARDYRKRETAGLIAGKRGYGRSGIAQKEVRLADIIDAARSSRLHPAM